MDLAFEDPIQTRVFPEEQQSAVPEFMRDAF